MTGPAHPDADADGQPGIGSAGSAGEGDPRPADDPPVTVLVERHAKPGHSEAFEAALEELIGAAIRFPGHQGVSVLRPAGPTDPFRVVFRFAHRSDLTRWEQSAERARVLAQLAPHAADTPRQQQATGLESFIDQPAPRPPMPSKLRQALLVWLTVYPLITALFVLGQPVLAPLPLPVRTLLVTLVMVPLMVGVLLPALSRLFHRWLFPPAQQPAPPPWQIIPHPEGATRHD